MDFIAFDIETTGTVAGVDKIIEIGAVKFIDGQVDSVFATLIDPKRDIPIEATQVNKITQEMVQGMPLIEDILEPFSLFCGDLPLVAHNAPFDFGFLLVEYQKYQTPAPNGQVLDTLAISKKVVTGLPKYNLGTLVSHFNITTSDFHRAQEDSNYCGQLFIKLLDKIKRPNQPYEQLMQQLVTLTGKGDFRFPIIEKQPKQLDLFGNWG